MGNASAKSAEIPELPPSANVEKPKLKPCCACPETKRARDACIIENGEEECGSLIEEHKACMRKMGFNI
ncbi:unnamed protein product [Pieris brassicae]|uniref:Cytochrome c oxidase copper chaperone n=1 Tax=Pieris brassicae TaxID=7116 RepID=A0A9P0TDN4_PIEBR|nr:unnamed protein product [Pieris brassicae]